MEHLTCPASLDLISGSWPFSSKWQIDRLGLVIVGVIYHLCGVSKDQGKLKLVMEGRQGLCMTV